TSSAGSLHVSTTLAPASPNLDAVLELLDINGNVLVSNNPIGSLTASISTTVSAGVYYLRIYGTGEGDPLVSGYTNYDSLGQYTIAGTFPGGNANPIITGPGTASGEVAVAFSYQIVAVNSPTGYGLTGTLPNGLMFDSVHGVISGTP